MYSLAARVNPAGRTYVCAGCPTGLYWYSNEGTNWNFSSSGLVDKHAKTLAVSVSATGDTLRFAGTDGGGIYSWADNGAQFGGAYVRQRSRQGTERSLAVGLLPSSRTQSTLPPSEIP